MRKENTKLADKKANVGTLHSSRLSKNYIPVLYKGYSDEIWSEQKETATSERIITIPTCEQLGRHQVLKD